MGLVALIAGLIGCGAPVAPEATDARIVRAAMQVADGVVFFAPVSDSEAPAMPFDADVAVSLEAFAFFEPSATAPQGPPVGPTLTTEDGSIRVRGETYAARWTARNRGIADGTLVRIELRLGNAIDGAPACNGGVDVDGSGCLAFFDVLLVERAVPPGIGDEVFVLRTRKALSIRFFIAEGAANVAPAVRIDAPEDEAILSDVEVTFVGEAIDLEDGVISSSIDWASDVDGFLGTGESVQVALSPGQHVVTASVTDSGGRSESASVTIVVDATVYTGSFDMVGPLVDVDTANCPHDANVTAVEYRVWGTMRLA